MVSHRGERLEGPEARPTPKGAQGETLRGSVTRCENRSATAPLYVAHDKSAHTERARLAHNLPFLKTLPAGTVNE